MDYTRNEDKLVNSERIGARYSYISNIENISSGSDEVTEPVTLAEVKDYLRLGGFISDDDSPSAEDDFTFDNTLIEDMITEAREWVEKYTGQHIVPKELQVIACNENGGLKLPGPVTGEVTLVEDGEDSPSDDLELQGTTWPSVRAPKCGNMTFTYNAGYETAPAWAKNAIKAYVAWAYENRGDESAGSPTRAAAICRAHVKLSAWR